MSGKIDRKALPRPGADARAGAGASTVAPRNPAEQGLVGIWREVLGLEAIGIHDNFFDLGGQSLKAVRLRARIEDHFGVPVALRDIFTQPTIAELAVVLNRLQGGAQPAEAALADLVAEMAPEELEAHLRQLER